MKFLRDTFYMQVTQSAHTYLTLVNYQSDAQLFYFITRLLQSSTI